MTSNKKNNHDYDFIIIGSGFGGSVSALRLTQKGYRVAVLEQGRRITPKDMEAANKSPLNFFWMPAVGLHGFFTQTIFKHVGIVGGVGLGGGSLVYAAVLIKPEDSLFDEPGWKKLGIDWKQELSPCYDTALKMFGCNPYPYFHQMDQYLKDTAADMHVADSFNTVPLGMYFGEPDKTVEDPYHDGDGPSRTGCSKCGSCLTGCQHGAKNSLDQNYLFLAEKYGAEILTEHQAINIRKMDEDEGYEIKIRHPIFRRKNNKTLRCKKIIIAAGVLGTVRLLFNCKDVYKTLPNISSLLGNTIRTNSEAIVGILSKDKDIDLSQGTTISSDFYPNQHTHITQNRFPKGYTFMKWYMGPLISEKSPGKRTLKTIAEIFRHPLKSTISMRSANWYKRISILTVMQNLDNHISFRLGRSPFTFFRKNLISISPDNIRTPAYIPEANQAAEFFSNHADGTPLNVILESLFNMSITAHILGGCPIGINHETGVINTNHELFGYPGIYITDASSIPANLGVNPALTITAMAERCMSKIPAVNG